MKTIKTTAPGNVMLMGEHAVLFGYRAIVCAVSQRMTVTLTPREDDGVGISSALGEYRDTVPDIFSRDSDADEKAFAFILASIRQVRPEKGFDLNIESEFLHTVGLGSSAAVTAACVYALMVYKNGYDTGVDTLNAASLVSLNNVFDAGLAVIHAVQKRGSGSDLAASVFGGMIAYSIKPNPHILPLLSSDKFDETHSPQLDLIYSGYKTPTPVVLEKVATSAEQFPEFYDAIYQQMGAITEMAQSAVQANDWQKLGKLMNMYHGLMDAIGVSDAKLSELVYRARDRVFGAKISGSGLGDCIITLSAPDDGKAHAVIKDDDHIDARITPVGLTLEVL